MNELFSAIQAIERELQKLKFCDVRVLINSSDFELSLPEARQGTCIIRQGFETMILAQTPLNGWKIVSNTITF